MINKKVKVYNKQKVFIGILSKNKGGYKLGKISVTAETLGMSAEILDIYYNIYEIIYI